MEVVSISMFGLDYCSRQTKSPGRLQVVPSRAAMMIAGFLASQTSWCPLSHAHNPVVQGQGISIKHHHIRIMMEMNNHIGKKGRGFVSPPLAEVIRATSIISE
jgi:hypothetical protein